MERMVQMVLLDLKVLLAFRALWELRVFRGHKVLQVNLVPEVNKVRRVLQAFREKMVFKALKGHREFKVPEVNKELKALREKMVQVSISKVHLILLQNCQMKETQMVMAI